MKILCFALLLVFSVAINQVDQVCLKQVIVDELCRMILYSLITSSLGDLTSLPNLFVSDLHFKVKSDAFNEAAEKFFEAVFREMKFTSDFRGTHLRYNIAECIPGTCGLESGGACGSQPTPWELPTSHWLLSSLYWLQMVIWDLEFSLGFAGPTRVQLRWVSLWTCESLPAAWEVPLASLDQPEYSFAECHCGRVNRSQWLEEFRWTQLRFLMNSTWFLFLTEFLLNWLPQLLNYPWLLLVSKFLISISSLSISSLSISSLLISFFSFDYWLYLRVTQRVPDKMTKEN